MLQRTKKNKARREAAYCHDLSAAPLTNSPPAFKRVRFNIDGIVNRNTAKSRVRRDRLKKRDPLIATGNVILPDSILQETIRLALKATMARQDQSASVDDQKARAWAIAYAVTDWVSLKTKPPRK